MLQRFMATNKGVPEGQSIHLPVNLLAFWLAITRPQIVGIAVGDARERKNLQFECDPSYAPNRGTVCSINRMNWT